MFTADRRTTLKNMIYTKNMIWRLIIKICKKCKKNYTRYKKFNSGVELFMHDYKKTFGKYKIPMTDYHYINLYKLKTGE